MLSVDRAAERLACSPRLVRDLVRRGELRASRVGRLVRIDERDLEAYLSRNAVQPATASTPKPPRRPNWRKAWQSIVDSL